MGRESSLPSFLSGDKTRQPLEKAKLPRSLLAVQDGGLLSRSPLKVESGCLLL